MRSYRPEGFTEEPYQDPEHMHTRLIKDIPALEESYIRVSDDVGEVFDDTEMEKKARELYQFLPQIQKGQIEKLELDELKKFTIDYCKKINKTLAIKNGAFCKYRIRLGALFIILKILVKNSGQLWENWFYQNFNGIIKIRFAQQCMQLSRIPISSAMRFSGCQGFWRS